MRTKATPSESTTPWERPKQWAMDWTIPDDWSQNVMDHCALRAARPSVFEPCWQVLAAERSVQRRFGGNWRLPSVVGGTRKHEWVAGDKVRIAIGGGAHTTGVVVALPDPVAGRGWWKVRRDGEKRSGARAKMPSAPSPRPLRHLWDASVTYNDRWFESRAELYARRRVASDASEKAACANGSPAIISSGAASPSTRWPRSPTSTSTRGALRAM